MATLVSRGSDAVPIDRIAQMPRVARALDWFAKNADWITDQQIRLTEIPSPTFSEERRAEALRDAFQSLGWQARIDSVGNAIAERKGTGRAAGEVVLLAAHLDTVFPADTLIRVKRQGTRLEAPGIADNGVGLASLLALARTINDANVETNNTLVLAGDVGEEGEGNLRGISKLVETYRSHLRAVIAIDGASADHITTQALASRRLEITIFGPGGHSWSDFGVPNPISALARGIVHFTSVRIPNPPRTTYNFGLIAGGTSINAIPESASVKVDLRSEDDRDIARLETALRHAMEKGLQEEMAAATAPAERLDINYRIIGVRPSGELPQDSFLLAAVRSVDRYLGNRSRLESSSTDANIPLSLGIPAVGLGGGGRAAGSHTLEEWYDTRDRAFGLRRLLLTTLALAGVQQ